MKTLIKTTITLLSFILLNSAQANLIVNGSFEQPDVATGTMKYFSASQVNHWEGRVIEVWDNHTNFTASHGQQYVELNAHFDNGTAFTLHQSFNTQSGGLYDLNFDYSARFSSDEAFQVDVFSGQVNIFSQIIDDHTKRNWSQFASSFVATSATSMLKFTSLMPSSATAGNFLDNIEIVERRTVSLMRATVPEPSSFILLVAGLLGWLALRIKR